MYPSVSNMAYKDNVSQEELIPRNVHSNMNDSHGDPNGGESSTYDQFSHTS